MFFHGPAYRAWHLTHHAYTFTPDDSEQLPDRFRSRLGYLGYCLILGPSFALILWFGADRDVVGKPPRWVARPDGSHATSADLGLGSVRRSLRRSSRRRTVARASS